jgi:hypothetical protein
MIKIPAKRGRSRFFIFSSVNVFSFRKYISKYHAIFFSPIASSDCSKKRTGVEKSVEHEIGLLGKKEGLTESSKYSDRTMDESKAGMKNAFEESVLTIERFCRIFRILVLGDEQREWRGALPLVEENSLYSAS